MTKSNTKINLNAEPAKEKILAERFKTQMCRNYERKGSCPYEAKCMFAHGEYDMRTPEMNVRDGLFTEASIVAFRRAQRLLRKRANQAARLASEKTDALQSSTASTTQTVDEGRLFKSQIIPRVFDNEAQRAGRPSFLASPCPSVAPLFTIVTSPNISVGPVTTPALVAVSPSQLSRVPTVRRSPTSSANSSIGGDDLALADDLSLDNSVVGRLGLRAPPSYTSAPMPFTDATKQLVTGNQNAFASSQSVPQSSHSASLPSATSLVNQSMGSLNAVPTSYGTHEVEKDCQRQHRYSHNPYKLLATSTSSRM